MAKADEGTQTGGGTQFWRDRLVVDDFRIQQHVRFGRVRVLSPTDRRVHTGTTFEEAHGAFVDAVGRPRSRGKHLVVLLHGYGGKTSRMVELRDAARAAGLVAEVVQYPSLFRTVNEIGTSITDLVVASAAFHGGRIEEVSLVAFSMGGLVASSVVVELAQRKNAPRVSRLVTIGTPHRGSPLAHVPTWLTSVGGPNIVELRLRNESALASLPATFGVVGGRAVRNGWTFFGVVGDGDGIVEIESAIVPGAADSLVVEKVKHLELPSDPRVIAGVLRFIETGRFTAA